MRTRWPARPKSSWSAPWLVLVALLPVLLGASAASGEARPFAIIRQSLFHGAYEFTTDGPLAFYALKDDFPVENSIRVTTNEIPLETDVDFVHDYLASTLQFTPPAPNCAKVVVTDNLHA